MVLLFADRHERRSCPNQTRVRAPNGPFARRVVAAGFAVGGNAPAGPGGDMVRV